MSLTVVRMTSINLDFRSNCLIPLTFVRYIGLRDILELKGVKYNRSNRIYKSERSNKSNKVHCCYKWQMTVQSDIH